ncbi:rod shape-determining protein MreC [Clostridium senegalense]|uniref:rod shape-determining protein MreC n=1 Tax=Clostridium senegalense TaxID=1465809 RepID=UPI001C0FF35F|nr:rod shape-determining protein MreC [Clostridium senegalense]MBU5225512.1 rod shape-determining protein MreC [Clostridium senegalense]
MDKLKNKLAVLVIILSVCFLFLIGYTVQRKHVSFVENGVGTTLNSVQGVVYNIGNKVKSSFSFIFHIKDLKSENEKLKEDNKNLDKLKNENTMLTEENARLRENLKFKDTKSDYEYIGADIVGLSGQNFLDGFTINRGSKDGIEKGMIAVTSVGLVGQVTSVGNNRATIQTLCNENIAVAGCVLSTKESDGIVKGYKGNEDKFLAEITGLSIDSGIKVGDTIVTSGLGAIYPKGIEIGKVLDVKEDKAAVMKSAVIKPSVDFNTLEQVLIVVDKENSDKNK